MSVSPHSYTRPAGYDERQTNEDLALFAVVLGALTFMIATVGINIVANFVSPAFDFSNVSPQKISWRMGGMIAAVGSVLLTPWNLYSSPEVIHYTWTPSARSSARCTGC